jgi:hypothetical protein
VALVFCFIGFKARHHDSQNSELCVVEVASSDVIVLHADANTMVEDFMWSPDDENLIVGLQNPNVQGPQMYSISRKNPGPPQLLSPQPARHKSYGYLRRYCDYIACAIKRLPTHLARHHDLDAQQARPPRETRCPARESLCRFQHFGQQMSAAVRNGTSFAEPTVPRRARLIAAAALS